jgi:hypothetical protein
VVGPAAHVFAWVNTRAALANNNVARYDFLAAKALHAKTLAL